MKNFSLKTLFKFVRYLHQKLKIPNDITKSLKTKRYMTFKKCLQKRFEIMFQQKIVYHFLNYSGGISGKKCLEQFKGTF